MKKLLRVLVSLFLIAACVFGLLAAYGGVQDVLNIKDYKEADLARAQDGLAAARDGIAQLMENESAYTEGVGTYNDGLVQLADGRQQLAEGAAKLAAGEQALADGKQQIADNTEKYNSGKAALEKIDPLMPYLDQYIQWRDSGLDSAPGFSTFQEWFVAVVRPIISSIGLEVPEDVTDFPAWMQAYVADGKAQLKQYEDGLVAIEEGEATLAQGYSDYADGQARLADGEQQLAEGDAKLKQYEDGQVQLVDGMYQLIDGMQEADRYRSGEKKVPGLLELLGGEFQPYVLNDDGSVKTYRGNNFVNLEECLRLCDEGDHYLDLSSVQTHKELYSRIASNALLLLASIFGIIAGLLGIISTFTGKKRTGLGFGIVTAILAIAGNIVGIIFKYHDLLFSVKDADGAYTYHGDQQYKALILLAIAAILFCIVAKLAKKCAKKAEEAKKAKKTETAAAPKKEEAAPAPYKEPEAKAEAATSAGFESRFDFNTTILKDALEDQDFVDTLVAHFPNVMSNPGIKFVQNKTLQEVFDFIPASKVPLEEKEKCKAALLAIPKKAEEAAATTAAAEGFKSRFDFDTTILKDALEDQDFVATLTAHFPTVLSNPAIKFVQNKTLQEVFDFIPASKVPLEEKEKCKEELLAIPYKEE